MPICNMTGYTIRLIGNKSKLKRVKQDTLLTVSYTHLRAHET